MNLKATLIFVLLMFAYVVIGGYILSCIESPHEENQKENLTKTVADFLGRTTELTAPKFWHYAVPTTKLCTAQIIQFRMFGTK